MNQKPPHIPNARWIQTLSCATLACCLTLHATPTLSADTHAAETLKAVRAYRSAHERAILDEFIQLLAIPNVASDQANITRNAEAIATMIKRRGLTPQLLESTETPGTPPLVYAEWKVPHAKRTLILYAHYDGQPVNPTEWSTDPWKPTLRTAPQNEGGSVIQPDSAGATDPEVRLYARGAGDDKAGVMVILSAIEALRALHRTPTDNLKIVFEGEEEAGSPHLSQLLTQHHERRPHRLRSQSPPAQRTLWQLGPKPRAAPRTTASLNEGRHRPRRSSWLVRRDCATRRDGAACFGSHCGLRHHTASRSRICSPRVR